MDGIFVCTNNDGQRYIVKTKSDELEELPIPIEDY